MRVLIVLFVLIMCACSVQSLKCYLGGEYYVEMRPVDLYDNSNQRKYCIKGLVTCIPDSPACTGADVAAGVRKWVYTYGSESFFDNFDAVNKTLCDGDGCNSLMHKTVGSLCYIGSGSNISDFNIGQAFRPDTRCLRAQQLCHPGNIYCTEEEKKRGEYKTVYDIVLVISCSETSNGKFYSKVECCTGDFCVRPPKLQCWNTTSGNTDSNFVTAPDDDMTGSYVCSKYHKICDGTENPPCVAGKARSYHGIMRGDQCRSLNRNVYRNISCCSERLCNGPMSCFYGQTENERVSMLVTNDGGPYKCASQRRNCATDKFGCSASEIASGFNRTRFLFANESTCNSDVTLKCCDGNLCNAPATLQCYNTANMSTTNQPDSNLTVTATEDSVCARVSYDCVNDRERGRCSPDEISKKRIKTVYFATNETFCESMKNEYNTFLDPQCCKTNLCNIKGSPRAPLICFDGQFRIGEKISQRNITTLPSIGDYVCSRKLTVCTNSTPPCTIADVSKNSTIVRYSVVRLKYCESNRLECCGIDRCNLVPGTLFIESTVPSVAVTRPRNPSITVSSSVPSASTAVTVECIAILFVLTTLVRLI
jgi:hypothetical protein